LKSAVVVSAGVGVAAATNKKAAAAAANKKAVAAAAISVAIRPVALQTLSPHVLAEAGTQTVADDLIRVPF